MRHLSLSGISASPQRLLLLLLHSIDTQGHSCQDSKMQSEEGESKHSHKKQVS